MNLYQERNIRYWYAPPTPSAVSSPIVLFLHGSGERGSNSQDVLKWGLPKSVSKYRGKTKFHLIAPQCPAGAKWRDIESEVTDVLCNVRQNLSRKVPLVAAGFSMGGQGVLEIAAANEGLFQLVVAVAPRNTERLQQLGYRSLARATVLLIHGELDPIAPVSDSKDIANAIQHAGGNPTLKTLSHRDHFMADNVLSIVNFHGVLTDGLDKASLPETQRQFGSARRLIRIADNFDEPIEDFAEYR